MKDQNLIRFASCFHALIDSIECIKHLFKGDSKRKMSLLYSHSMNLYKDITKQMNEDQKTKFELMSELSHECLNEFFKYPHPSIMLQVMKEVNAGNLIIEKE
jgi:hypothetical protein